MKRNLIYSVIFSLLSLSAVADDTELFTGDNSSAASNVIFIFDTSGSMGTEDGIINVYDPDTVYDNSAYGFQSDKYYLYRPSSTSNFEQYLADNYSNIVRNEVSASQINCSTALNSASTTGEYGGGEMAYWRNGQGWFAPYSSGASNDVTFNSSDSTGLVECRQGTYSYGGNSYDDLSSGTSSPYTNSWRPVNQWWFCPLFCRSYTYLWSGNYLNYVSVYGDSGGEVVTRMDILRAAAKDTIQSLPDNVNVSIMRFNLWDGGRVVVAMKPGKANYDEFESALDALAPEDNTTITETMHESMLYATEQAPLYGTTTYGSGSVSDSKTADGSSYLMPELSACSISTKVVLFSDGEPWEDAASNEYVADLIGDLTTDPTGTLLFDCNSLTSSLTGQSSWGMCAEELAYYMKSEYGITVDTIGGFTSSGSAATTKLEDIAEAGGGKFYPADDYLDIKNALLESSVQTLIEPASYTSPAIAVSSYNSLEISDELYYAVFEPTQSFAWSGNLKRYAISSSGIVDKNGNAAVDPGTGFFSSEATSFWSDVQDGNQVTLGGAAAQQDPATRNIYTIDNGRLRSFDPDNASYIQDTTLGLDLVENSDTDDPETGFSYRDELLHWIAGYRYDATQGGWIARTAMEDPLHSRPVVINYAEGEQVVYVGSNSGYLHAIDTSDGTERFAILPEETLKNPNYYLDSSLMPEGQKLYALDGPITYWHDDHNLNGKVDGTDTVYLYVGQRRGGHSYYALNVTDPDNPSVLWIKHGNYTDTSTKNAPSASSGFSHLGQTWSSLRPALIKWNGADKVVLFAGGGYDPDEDGTDEIGPASRITHDTGNTVYLLDASTGSVLWDALTDLSPSSMTSSFPADVVPVDRNNNGYVDLLYAADVGGRVWRFDISEAATSRSNFATGGVIADINTSSSDGISGNRRFYNRPDVSYITNADTPYILISIGSGYRAHPLSTDITDYQLLLKDPYGLSVPDSYSTTLTLSDLMAWYAQDAEDSVHGWYLQAGTTGEKVLSASVTLSGIVTFNSYIPAQETDDTLQCTGAMGQSNIYQLALTDAAYAQADCEEGGSCPARPGETVEPVQSVVGLAPDPTITLPPADDTNPDPSCEDSSLVILSGTSTTSGHLNRCDLFNTDYWKENR